MNSQNNNLDKIEHIVVLMMENRSFDNILGYLYDPKNPPPFNKTPKNGELNGVDEPKCNPRPNSNETACTSPGTDYTAPFPDPNEPYEFVYRQMFNEPIKPPPVPWGHGYVPNKTETPYMQGFVIDYAEAIAAANAKNKKKCWLFRKPPLKTDPGVIMNCFAPSSLPAINTLAQSYAVCDNWFSSVPTQTFPNRSFVHAATSSGNVYNMWKTGKELWDFKVFVNKTKTIYELLEDAGKTWKIYHGGPLLLCNTLLIQERLWKYVIDENHICGFDKFKCDLDEGKLPAYSFIEPNMLCSEEYGAENDMHPAYAVFTHGPPTDVRYGDELIYNIYNALAGSKYWEKTLFIITFDEHGGCFDHAAPPQPAVSPDGIVLQYTNGADGGSGFDFARYGVRVPAVLVSPWIEEGTICSTLFDHTSIIKTASNKWLNGQNLTNRDLNANDVSEVLNLDAARKDKCDIKLNPPPTFTGCTHQALSPLHSEMLLAAAHFLAKNHDLKIDLKALTTKQGIVSTLEGLAKDLRPK